MKLNKILILSIFLLFSGCFNNTQTIYFSKIKYPKWYLTPPKDNNIYVYSTGIGINKEQAIKNALVNFISKYEIEINSKMQIKKQQWYGGLVNENTKYIVNAKTNNLKICCYKVLKVKQIDFDKIVVLIQINKQKLSKYYTKKLKKDFAFFVYLYDNLKKFPPIKRYLMLKQIMKNLKKEEKIIQFVKQITPETNLKNYEKFINKIKDKIGGVEVSIKNINCPKIFVNDITKYLTQKGFVVIPNSDNKLELKCIIKTDKNQYLTLKKYIINISNYYKDKLYFKNVFIVVLPENSSLDNILYNEIKNKKIEKFFNFN